MIVINQDEGHGIEGQAGDAVPGKGPEIIGGYTHRKGKYDGEYQEELDVGIAGYGAPYFAEPQHEYEFQGKEKKKKGLQRIEKYHGFARFPDIRTKQGNI